MIKGFKLKHLKDLAIVFFSGFSNVRILSMDVTYKCNLNCKTCYFKRYSYANEMSDSELLEKISQFKKDTPNCYGGWIGGEPLLRKELVKKA